MVAIDFSAEDTEMLRVYAQGCTELTCMYHGAINEELRRRGLAE